MLCKECQSALIAYISGDLSEEAASACRAHLSGCERCRRVLECYKAIIGAMVEEPQLKPSASEAAAMACALARVPMRQQASRQLTPRSAYEFLAFALASAAMFAILAILLALQMFGRIDLISLPRPLGLLRVVGIVIVVIFVTSFLPIVVTARRRPLNGTTFAR